MAGSEIERGLEYDGFVKGTVNEGDISARLKGADKDAIYTGVSVIDSVFGGILKNDIVLLGAKTGVGKTSLASTIALNNTLNGKNVFMYALEAEPEEIQMRILYERTVAFAARDNPFVKYNYKHWRLGRYKNLDHYQRKALESVGHFKNFNVYYRKKEFSVEDFVKITMSVKNEADLIIIDHIHYFDLDGRNENKELSDAIKKIRDIALLVGIPIIILAHLRKGANVQTKIMPDLDDFMGSSDLTKVCTKALIVSPGKIKGDFVDTYFYFAKFRGFSTPSKYLFKCPYNIYANAYAPTFTAHEFTYNNISYNAMEHIVDTETLTWLG